jgi:acyl-CoA reductase-like NAD-dependent aldehyde dehydrogenase
MGRKVKRNARGTRSSKSPDIKRFTMVLKNYHFEEPAGSAVVVRVPVGVIGMITPWNCR